MKDIITIRTYGSETSAMMYKMLLEGCAIDAAIQKDDCGGMLPYLQVATGVRLMVRAEDRQKAEEILNRLEVAIPV